MASRGKGDTVLAGVGAGGAHSWEDTSGGHLWENAVQEDEDGRIVVADAAESLAVALRNRRRRAEQNDYSLRHKRVVRDMIRYVYVLIDASRWMREKDPVVPPGTRLDATIQLLQEFTVAFFDENPLSHLGFVLLKNGEAEILTQLSTTARAHKVALQSVIQMVMAEASGGAGGRGGGGGASKNANGGEFSLQNGLTVAGRSLGHQPRHGSREIVVLTAALSTCDPSNILAETLPRLQAAKIRVSCYALSAELHVCRKICQETGGSMGVCLDKAHFREWLLNQTVPPPATAKDDDYEGGNTCELVEMGFPTRTVSEVPALVHHASREKTILSRTAYSCPQCQAKHAELPTDCQVCGLKLVLSPHLARSFHSLFPVPPFVQVMTKAPKSAYKMPSPVSSSSPSKKKKKSATSSSDVQLQTPALNSFLLVRTSEDGGSENVCCLACLRPFETTKTKRDQAVLLSFACPDCHNLFCVDCDAFLHESLHNCPGCLAE